MEAAPKCLRLNSFEVRDDGIIIAADSASALTAATNAIQRAFPIADLALEVKPRAMLQFGYVGRVGGGERITRTELVSLGRLLVAHLMVENDLDECHALDFHQDELEDGSLGKTEIGEEVYRAKYQSSKPDRLKLMERAKAFIRDHPRYRNADRLTFVPPHTMQPKSSVAERIARALAPEVEKELLHLGRVEERDPQKDVDEDDRTLAMRRRSLNQYLSMRCGEDITVESVIVIDDLLGTGSSLSEGARALRAAGAVAVFGLAMTKTRKFARLS